MNTPIAVAVSGGIDSLVAAHLLKEEGHALFAVHFTTGFEPPAGLPAAALPDVGALQEMARRLGIALYRVDLTREFKREVVDYVAGTYLAGATPNPCLVCNPRIKFGALLQWAGQKGARSLATGHYARVRRDADGRCRLYKGADPHKDQSYFLARLGQEQLQRAVFPLGGLTKAQVRAWAQRHRLAPAVSEESQDICFIRGGRYPEVLALPASPGRIEDVHGNLLGEHQGLHRFTIGQRRGINRPAARPYYVVRLDRERNRLVVGSKEDLLAPACRVTGINWVLAPPEAARRVATRVRYRTREVPATLTPIDERSARVAFDAPQSALTPGQAAVFYDGDEVLGSGFIAAPGE
ncbi:MAG: tRNA 2-thiouridine(34) synthase MnmA [Desulfobacterales bacterium]|jgi:tRNA-specific 2-thiouridylase|nr:tRNA 2-thiouridine(34) synthase MnmA [Desulfobacterales bacterium]